MNTSFFDFTDNSARSGQDGRARTILWWGRFDPDYARNRILRRCLQQSAWRIADLSGLEHFAALEVLRLDQNQIIHLDPLSPLTALRELSLNDNRVDTLTPLSTLKNLERLGLTGNLFSDITGIDFMRGLQFLDLEGNTIDDFSALYLLRDLNHLNLARTGIGNLFPLFHLIQLEKSLDGKNFTVLKGLHKFEKTWYEIAELKFIVMDLEYDLTANLTMIGCHWSQKLEALQEN